MSSLETYYPEGKFLWDLWFIKDRNFYHAFYLQSEPTQDPEERHNNNVSIGHAISDDFGSSPASLHWTELPTALEPGRKGEWDDFSLWTGSVIKKGGRYYMFFTGRNHQRGQMWVQKIGLAVSDNLVNWKKHPGNPILTANSKYYQIESSKNKLGKIGAFRDPYVFRDPVSGKYCMTISAREKNRKREYNGCIGAALSDDLINWEVKPPILSPGRYDEMETSQVIYHKGKYYLFFSVLHTGLHCYFSDELFGKYRPVNKNGVVLEKSNRIYDIRLLTGNPLTKIKKDKSDKYWALGWLNLDPQNRFIGRISKPFKISIKGNKVYPTTKK